MSYYYFPPIIICLIIRTECSDVSDFVELAQLAGIKIAPNVVR